jgi:hypothetical protein
VIRERKSGERFAVDSSAGPKGENLTVQDAASFYGMYPGALGVHMLARHSNAFRCSVTLVGELMRGYGTKQKRARSFRLLRDQLRTELFILMTDSGSFIL